MHPGKRTQNPQPERSSFTSSRAGQTLNPRTRARTRLSAADTKMEMIESGLKYLIFHVVLQQPHSKVHSTWSLVFASYQVLIILLHTLTQILWFSVLQYGVKLQFCETKKTPLCLIKFQSFHCVLLRFRPDSFRTKAWTPVSFVKSIWQIFLFYVLCSGSVNSTEDLVGQPNVTLPGGTRDAHKQTKCVDIYHGTPDPDRLAFFIQSDELCL